jgi:pullulanase/glycogen debranching enzyme
VQTLGNAIVAFSQGIAYFHAGQEVLRSKSLDRNSYDSGDWFNRLDWTLTDNGFGAGLPPAWDNQASWPLMQPLLADAARLKPTPTQIRYTRDAFADLLRIRAGSTLFRLRTTADVQQRLQLLNTGPAQVPTVLVGHLDGRGHAGAGFDDVLYAINADPQPQTLTLPTLAGRALVLHPVHRAETAADTRPREQARWDSATGRLTVPARTAVVWVAP